ncbi:hypothetical protein [Pontiella sulfatireligans]|uniref:Uncharacterized protein n=1 Tax=Pontiella sulfatireligans TaxID=2750658 RepID=A0A6C2UE06_9BACT|nr:hypothetical protein [Pontiella sulfatireligans]VGO18400.1 hypothetical protein SCARR_00452 [Pontiella sulfatireligans]
MGKTDEIDEVTAEGACKIVDWCLSSTIQLLQGARSDALERASDKLEEKLCNSDYNGVATLRQLKKRHGFETEKIE